MSVTDYVIDLLLIVIIFRQVRMHELTTRSAVLPLLLMAVAGFVYLRPVDLHGNDLALIAVLAAAGIAIGIVSGMADNIRLTSEGRVLARAGVISVVAWVAGMGSRFGFEYYAYHSGSAAVARYSIAHDITGARIWTTALVLMAFGQVIARVGLLQIRRIRLTDQAAARHLASSFADGRR
jgi:hypothetical protein